jgi:hypothetical protein
MKQSIFDSVKQSSDATQSFVIRVWQEKPDHLRGTIQHIQSEAKRGFERFEQMQSFIEQKLPVPVRPTNQPLAFSRSLPRFGRRTAFALITGLVVVTGALLYGNSFAVIGASATALAVPSLDSVITFLAGTVLGGITVGTVLHLLK